MSTWFFTGIVAGTALGTLLSIAMLVAMPRRDGRGALAGYLASGFGIGAGLAVTFAGDSALFEAWWRGFDRAFAPAAHGLGWFHAIGALIVLHYAVIAAAIRMRGARTAGKIGAWSVALWFAVDSTSGMLTGGAFNVLLINVPAFAVGMPAYIWMSTTTRSLPCQ